MKSIDKFVLVLVASLALLLAGCGGGSSSTAPVDPGPTPEEMAAAAIMEAKDALTTAEGQLSGATTDAEMLAAYQAIHGAAQNLITVLGANGGSADDIVAATVTRQNAAGMIASLTEKIADAAEAAAAAALAAMIKEVGTKNAAMDAEKAQTTDGGLGGTTASAITAGDPGSYALSIKRNRMGTTVEVTVNGATDADDVKLMSSDVSDGLTKHVRTHKADDDGNVMEETAMVMTDIAAPKATPFNDVHALDTRKDAVSVDANNPADALNLASAAAANWALMKAPRFAPGQGTETTVLTFDSDDSTTAGTDEAAEVSGTYDGASGTYRCGGGTDCTVTLDDMGMITATSGGWIFIPNMDVTVDVPDAMYHHYGFWIKKTTDSDGVVTYNEVETFTGVTGMATHDTSGLTGTAKYSGGALGVYTHKVLDPEGESTAVSGGHFTADANLTANFTGDSVAVDDHNSITGTIDNFMLAGGESNNWSVSLEGTNASGVITGTDWSAQFYGTDVDGTPGVDTATDTPAAILGEFNAEFVNGQVAGSFGVDLQDE